MRHLTCILIAAVVIVGCHRQSAPDETPSSEETRQPVVYDTATGEQLTPEQLYDRLEDARFVVVGESHGTDWHHALQTKLYEELVARSSGEVALGMEMFQRPFQPALDAYVAGEIDESTMLERTEYENRWGLDPSFYRPLWRRARHNGAPIVALNARAELTRTIAQKGLEELSDEQRAQLPDGLDTSNQKHREFVRQVFSQHGQAMSNARFESFYQAQVVWDETMAATAAEFLRSHRDLSKMMIVCGKFHALDAFAIPPRLARRLSSDHDSVVSVVPRARSETDRPEALDDLDDAELADYSWVQGRR